MGLHYRKALQQHKKIWNKETNSKEFTNSKFIHSTEFILLFTNSPDVLRFIYIINISFASISSLIMFIHLTIFFLGISVDQKFGDSGININ